MCMYMCVHIQGVSSGIESIDIEKSTHQKILKIYIFTNVGVASPSKIITFRLYRKSIPTCLFQMEHPIYLKVFEKSIQF